MANQDTGWRPEGAMFEYNGNEVYFHNVGPHERNPGEVDGDIEFDEEFETDDE